MFNPTQSQGQGMSIMYRTLQFRYYHRLGERENSFIFLHKEVV